MFNKIKEFFKNLFQTNKPKYIEAPKEVVEPINNNQVQTSLKSQIIINNEEDNRILKLQEDYKAGLIEEEDLSEEDFDLLTELYEKQIEKTKQSIQMYKNKILSIKSQLVDNN